MVRTPYNSAKTMLAEGS